jgi:hypothetical protein
MITHDDIVKHIHRHNSTDIVDIIVKYNADTTDNTDAPYIATITIDDMFGHNVYNIKCNDEQLEHIISRHT